MIKILEMDVAPVILQVVGGANARIASAHLTRTAVKRPGMKHALKNVPTTATDAQAKCQEKELEPAMDAKPWMAQAAADAHASNVSVP